MKKVLSLIISSVLTLSVIFTAGCDDKNPEEPSVVPVDEKVELEIDESNLLLTLGDVYELSASYTALAGKNLTWTSSAPGVVSVDSNGKLDALGVGSATVTANYADKQASCNVEVSTAGFLPTLVLENVSGGSLTLLKGRVFDLNACVCFNGKKFYDADIQYSVQDKSVGEVKNGEFIAADKTGETAISIAATWRGLTVRPKILYARIISETSVVLNGGKINSLDLFTSSSHEGKTYPTEQAITSVDVEQDGKRIENYELSVLDTAVAEIERSGNGWKVSAKSSGKTALVVSYGEIQYPFDITVSRPVADSGKIVDYSISDAKYYDEDRAAMCNISDMIDGFDNIVSYVVNGKEYKFLTEALNVKEGSGYDVTLYSEKVGYTLTLNAYTTVIDEMEDFKSIYCGTTSTDIGGSYALCRDIIEPDYLLSMPDGKVPNNFAGVFDGKGHVISFTLKHGTIYRFGLFGDFLKGATIKNLALSGITMDGTGGKNPAGVICGEGSDGKSTTPQSTIENVYVDVCFTEEKRSSYLAFMGNAMWATVLKNVIIHAPNVPVSDTYGSFARGQAAQVSNSYVISEAPTYITTEPTNYKNNIPTLYASYSAMKEADNDYSTFSVEFWDTTTYGVPVWKTLKDDFNW